MVSKPGRELTYVKCLSGQGLLVMFVTKILFISEHVSEYWFESYVFSYIALGNWFNVLENFIIITYDFEKYSD